MQRFSDYFLDLKTSVLIRTTENIDLQYMLKKASLLITDYSSIYFDFAYMRKPLLYYHFDYEKYRKGHYEEGYFSYKDDRFGEVCETPDELCNTICEVVKNDMKISQIYLDRINRFFTFKDTKNSERVYNAIMEKLDKEKK